MTGAGRDIPPVEAAPLEAAPAGAAPDLPGLAQLDLRPDACPASLRHRVLNQARADARAMLRNGEQVTLTVLLPAMMLAGLTFTKVPYLGPGPRVDVATPGVLALGVLSTAFTGLAIGTAFDRRYGVLRLLGTTPLGRSGLVAGRVLALLVVECLQWLLFGAVGLALGWNPRFSGLPGALLALVLGTVAFASFGLLLAGTLRAEAVLPAANLIWVVLIVIGGAVVPAERLGAIGTVAQVLPSSALGQFLRAVTANGTILWGPLAVLSLWAVAGTAAAVRWFRWD